MLEPTIDVIALLAVGGLWGGMAFFAAVYAPLVFIKLEAEVAGQFIRQVFPAYYLAMGVTSLVAAAALAAGSTHGTGDVGLMILVFAGFLVVRQGLMPLINRTRDRHLAGDEAAGKQFQSLHRLSVIINTIQLLVVFLVLVRFVWN